ncbi:MAG: hypothetical protein KAJ07_00490 [Planctomycetes bacterium]|nr:hypothetical protein [Planctomycetota bacterium]
MPDGQVFNLPEIFQRAETVKANRLSSRINELRLAGAETASRRATQRQDILAGGGGPQELAGAGLVDEAFDLKKIQDESTANSLAIRQGVANLKGTKLTNAKKKFNVLGLANLALTDAYTELIQKGTSRPEAIIKLQPLLNKTNEALRNADFSEQDLMVSFDPERSASFVNMSKEALGEIGTRETREGTEATRKATEKERVTKRAEAKVKTKRGARKRLSDIGVAKARLLSRTPVDESFAKLMGIEGVNVQNVEEVKAALATLESEAVALRNEFNLGGLEEIFGGK